MHKPNKLGPLSSASTKFTRLMRSLAVAGCLVAGTQATAAPVTYGFDGFADSTALTTQIAALTFDDATVLSAGVSLNEFEFPPRSGTNVLVDDGGALSISFLAPVFGVGGFFTYLTGITFAAYDETDTLIGSVTSAFASNLALGGSLGSTPNEFLSIVSPAGDISRIVITGSPLGASFALDDLMVDATRPGATPEPSTLVLTAPLLGLLVLRRRRQRARQAVE